MAIQERGFASVARWLLWPGVSAIVLCAIWFQPEWRGWFEMRVSALRFVIYAIILIVLMLLRPQGLLGRSEFGWHLFRRAQNKRSEQNATGTLE
jgi:hypothetical protein